MEREPLGRMKSSDFLAACSYYETREFVVTLCGQAIRVVSKPGIPNWDTVTPANTLLADEVKLYPTSRILLLGCGHGALGVSLARQATHGEVVLMDTNYVATQMAKTTLRLNGIANARVSSDVSVLPAYSGAFDLVVMVLPRGAKLVRRLLVEAYSALRVGGSLYLAGGKQQGVKSGISNAKSLFGNVATLAYRKGERVAVATKETQEPHDVSWAKEPGISPRTWHEFRVTTHGDTLCLRTLPGIFSYDRIDDGTRLLLEALEIPRGSKVLDVGCGYGIIGLVASRIGAEHVDLVDIDLLAIASTRENIILNNVENTQAIPSDLMSSVADRRYDVVVANPPFHVGMATDYEVVRTLIVDAHNVLEPDGKLIIVSNKFLPYDRFVVNVFGNAQCSSETNRYRLIVSQLRL